jgi:diaminohydroxyphosphoribosylaminopyrimidine deaminase / 5-amino-6-(5-phosphoribosylamino)uracil reductase
MPVASSISKLPGRTLVLTSSANDCRQQVLNDAGFEIYQLADKDGRLDLFAVMEFLADQQVNELLVEAGSTLNGALLAAGLVDEWIIYIAPCVLGDQGRGLFHIPGLQRITDKISLTIRDVRQIGPDLRLILTR